MAEYDYDLFVIGGGSGGVRAARIAAQHGAKVGDCRRIPVRRHLRHPRLRAEKATGLCQPVCRTFEDAVGFGWTTSKVEFDWPTLIANKDREIDRLNKVYEKNLEAAGVELFHCRAELRDTHSVRLVGLERHITTKYVLIATGGQPNIDHDLEGIEHTITSNDALHLETLPESMIIAGGGYIAVEFACIFNGLGVDTTLLYRGEKILRGFDEDVRDHLTAEMKKKGVDVVCGQVFSKIEKKGTKLHGTLTGGDVLEVDQIMFAIGRNAYTGGLGLENAGVELRENGSIKVDEYSKTSVDTIYAVGDVTDRVALTPVAIREGHAFADTVFGGKDIKVDHDLIATAVFSQPEIGTVGLTEAQARERYKDVDIYKSVFRPMRHTLSGRDEKMLMKLVVVASTGRVAGCHILGPDAGEMAQMLGILLRMGATKADFDATMAVHPTAAEELVTMRTKWSG
jgi:glutathione reductase (NADPH)